MNPRPRLLFLAPAMPASTGNGLAMRGWTFLQGYSRSHDVHLVVLPLSGSGEPTREVQSLCARVDVLPVGLFSALVHRLVPGRLPSLCRYNPQMVWQFLREVMAQAPVAVVHVQRLYMAPAIEPLLGQIGPPRTILDLDDDESRTFGRLAELHQARGEEREARSHASDAARFTALAEALLPRFDQVAVCSQSDAQRLAQAVTAARLVSIPNAPPQSVAMAARTKDIDLLFVGTFGYLPNRDGAEWLARQVLPLLPPTTRTWLVGPCPEDLRKSLSAIPGMTVVGWVDDLAPYYARAACAVAPIRAGGGTRIKILEAVALGVPVVSTGLGAEGLEFHPGQHLLLADTPAAFAAACRQAGGELRAEMARAFLEERGSRAMIQDRIGKMTTGRID